MVVDLDAIAANTAVLRERVGRPLMAVVKADGYGHGLVPAARAVLAGGADALGVAVLEEALALRAAGHHRAGAGLAARPRAPTTRPRWPPTSRSRSTPSGRWPRSSPPPARPAGPPGCTCSPTPGCPARAPRPADWPGLVAAAARAQADGEVAVVGLWSHMAYADAPTHPTIGAQVRVFEEAVALARGPG